MSKRLTDRERIGPDAEDQLIEDVNGTREIRCRSARNQPMVVRTRAQALALIAAVAQWALGFNE